MAYIIYNGNYISYSLSILNNIMEIQKEYTYKSYQQDKKSPKYYRNNPLISNILNKQN